jgi:hypothetical protein
MGKSIGSLGRHREPLDLEFDYFGSVVRVHPYATDEVEVEFLEAGKDLDLEEIANLDPATFEAMDGDAQRKALQKLTRAQREGYLAMMRALRRLVHPDDFDAYMKLGAEHGQQVVDRMRDIKAITEAVIEAVTDFPTQPRSGSPSGPAITPASSGDVSPSREVSDYEKGLALYRGRPDLQEFVIMQKEAEEQADREARESAARDRQKLTDAGLA